MSKGKAGYLPSKIYPIYIFIYCKCVRYFKIGSRHFRLVA